MACGILLLGIAAGLAQVTTADVIGTVTDATGATLPNATITIENIDTRVSRSATTGEDGSYVFTFVPIGKYTVRVVASGFKEFSVPSLTLASGDRTRIDAQMSLGERTEKVEVQAQAAILQTDSSQLSSLITTKAVQDLPLNGRSDQGGPNLLRSLTALSDQHGELISPIIHGARQDKGMPAFNLSDADSTAVAEYIHSVLSQVGAKARPPGKADISDRDVLVGNAAEGQIYFQAKCASCHSVTGDLKSVATRYKDPRTLQNAWVAGGITARGSLPLGNVSAKSPKVTLTFANGQKLEGTLVRKDDFIITLLLPDGERRSVSRNGGDAPKVEVHDPLEAHRQLASTLKEKDMHNVTAYLATIK